MSYLDTDGVTRDAVLSDCGIYRYRLTRAWSSSDPRRVLWVMLNPSTADAYLDDPTIRRCVGFSRAWGYGGLEVVNLFALRATDPADLADSAAAGIDPVGPDNDRHLAEASCTADLTVVAWGAHPYAERRAAEVLPLLDCPVNLGTTRSGAPRHPLYLPKTARPEVHAA